MVPVLGPPSFISLVGAGPLAWALRGSLHCSMLVQLIPRCAQLLPGCALLPAGACSALVPPRPFQSTLKPHCSARVRAAAVACSQRGRALLEMLLHPAYLVAPCHDALGHPTPPSPRGIG